MKIKALWGWVGAKGAVRSGDVIDVDEEYGHQMIGKGLAVEFKSEPEQEAETKPEAAKKAEAATNKQAAPKETK